MHCWVWETTTWKTAWDTTTTKHIRDFKATKAHLFLLLPDYHDFFRKFLKPQSGDNILFAGEDKGYFFLHEKTIYLFQLVFLLNNSQNIK